MKYIMILGLYLSLLGAKVSLNNFRDFNNTTLRIAGGTAHIPIIKAVAKKIQKINPNIKIALSGGGSGIGIKKVGISLVDIGNSGRELSKNEKNKYHLKTYKIAIDGIAVVINRQNKLTNLTQKQIQYIFNRKITNWNKLGGIDKNINIYTRDKASGTRAVFYKKVLNKHQISPKAIFQSSNGAMKRAIQNDIYGIGFISAGFIDEKIKAISINGVAPTIDNITNGKYKFRRYLYTLTSDTPTKLTKTFIKYLISKEIQNSIVPKQGFIGIIKQ